MSEKFGLVVITYPASNQHTVYNPNNNLHLHLNRCQQLLDTRN